ncbi:MAG: hypothetical protein K6T81_17750 [Alicyclobacillus macrosporangiidus]|uniref:magnesium transporter MgtE N-terminal domain-containing protein n=1 Tax=Alicyclobacillus macrosporangiidus TaxID=392015 RepID=UPI0026F26329|nr:hypothetical protein [Alicyclobacillus macrosporangiidus]MCL6600556.1 hypothetical protein [Alicyclobacillus macrosporangiidus]
MQNRSSASQERRPVGRMLAWAGMVVVIPALATVAMIGGALQLAGVPVWQTLRGWATHSDAKAVTETPLAQTQQALANAQQKLEEAAKTIDNLQQQLTAERQAEANLRQQLTQAQAKVQAQATARDRAAKEAQWLSGMDPGQAAGLLQSLPASEAAQVVALMPSDVSAQVLAALPAGKAAPIMTAAAAYAGEQTTAGAADSVGNSAG